MRRIVVGVATAFAMSFSGPAIAVDMTEEIQDEEQPGSEIEMDIGGGGVSMERESGAPVFRPGDVPPAEGQLDVPDDPDAPAEPDPVDAELPGEGPESLSGPDDDDPLPE
jgi:hypothetical protein